MALTAVGITVCDLATDADRSLRSNLHRLSFALSLTMYTSRESFDMIVLI